MVWNALVDPDAIRQYMFGATVSSYWHEGHPIKWKGEWQGKPYEDKGVILKVKPLRLLQYSHTIELTADDHQTVVTITQDKNADREARVHSEKNWSSMLASLKKLVEAAEASHAGSSAHP